MGSWSTRFFWADWLGDPLVRQLNLAERGLWIDVLALCAQGTPVGYLTDREGRPLTTYAVAKIINADRGHVRRLLERLVNEGVASRDGEGRIYNRRMVRTENGSKYVGAGIGTGARAKSGSKGGTKTRQKWLQLQGAATVLPQQSATANLGTDTVAPLSSKKEREVLLWDSFRVCRSAASGRRERAAQTQPGTA